MKKKISLLLYFGCCLFLQVSGQADWLVTGKVVGEEGILPFATVYAINRQMDSSAILAFTTTDNQGNFDLKIDSSFERVTLVCNYLGYQEKRIEVEATTKDHLEIFLQIQDSKLQEVIVTERQLPVNTRGDTIVYNVAEFRDSTENTLEDLLKKLPGVEVQEDGQIMVRGEPIKKMMIEGTDMFGRQYTIGSRNIRADFIQSVEVIDHYQENQVAKNILSSEDVVLNIKLTEDAKGVLSGIVIGGLGYGEEIKRKLDANIFSITKRHKFLLINNSGNTGQQYGIEELGYAYDQNDRSYINDAIQMNAVFTRKESPRFLGFNRPFLDNGQSSFTTLRTYADLGKSTTINFNTYLAQRKDHQRILDQTSFLYENGVFENNLDQKINVKDNLAKADLTLRYINPKVTQSFDLYIDYQRKKHTSNVSFLPIENISQLAQTTSTDLNSNAFLAHAVYTLKLNEKNVLFVTSKNDFIQMPEIFVGTNPNYPLLFPLDSVSNNMNQEILFTNQLHDLFLSYAGRFGGLEISAETGFLLSQFTFDSELVSVDTSSQAKIFSRIQNIRSDFDHSWKSSVSLSKAFGRQAKIGVNLSSIYRTLKVEEKREAFSPEETLSFKVWGKKEWNQKKNIAMTYVFQRETLPNFSFLPASYFQDGFSFYNDSFRNQLPSGHSFFLHYSHNDLVKLRNYQIGASLGWKQANWSSAFDFIGNLVNSKPFFIEDNNSINIFTKWEQFLLKVKTNLEIKPSFFRGQYKAIEGGNTRLVSTNRWRINTQLAWRINKTFLLSMKSKIEQSYFSSQDNSSVLNELRWNPLLSVKQKKWKIETMYSYRRTFNQNQSVELVGTNLKIETKLKIRKWTSDVSLEFYNLLNTKWYKSISTSDYFIFTQQVEAIPSFFLFSFNHSF